MQNYITNTYEQSVPMYNEETDKQVVNKLVHEIKT